jgi:hypothetical protein
MLLNVGKKRFRCEREIFLGILMMRREEGMLAERWAGSWGQVSVREARRR